MIHLAYKKFIYKFARLLQRYKCDVADTRSILTGLSEFIVNFKCLWLLGYLALFGLMA